MSGPNRTSHSRLPCRQGKPSRQRDTRTGTYLPTTQFVLRDCNCSSRGLALVYERWLKATRPQRSICLGTRDARDAYAGIAAALYSPRLGGLVRGLGPQHGDLEALRRSLSAAVRSPEITKMPTALRPGRGAGVNRTNLPCRPGIRFGRPAVKSPLTYTEEMHTPSWPRNPRLRSRPKPGLRMRISTGLYV